MIFKRQNEFGTSLTSQCKKGYVDQWYGYINANLQQYGWILLSFLLTGLKEETNQSGKSASAQAPQLRADLTCNVTNIENNWGQRCPIVQPNISELSPFYMEMCFVTQSINHYLVEVAMQLSKDWGSSLC